MGSQVSIFCFLLLFSNGILTFGRNGDVENWDIFEALWNHAIEDVLCCDPRDHPLLTGVATYESDSCRAKQSELFFEKFEVPAFFLARNAILSAFAFGCASALVIDAGAAKVIKCFCFHSHI